MPFTATVLLLVASATAPAAASPSRVATAGTPPVSVDPVVAGQREIARDAADVRDTRAATMGLSATAKQASIERDAATVESTAQAAADRAKRAEAGATQALSRGQAGAAAGVARDREDAPPSRDDD